MYLNPRNVNCRATQMRMSMMVAAGKHSPMYDANVTGDVMFRRSNILIKCI